MRYVHATKRPAYTLIEMLIAVSIFSGLLIIVLGSIASTSSSSAKVSLLRDKNQAARNLIDQISNDFRYVDTTIVLKDGNNFYNGYSVVADRLVMAIHLPNTNSDTELIRKEYNIHQFNNRLTLTLIEGRNCSSNSFLQNCAQQSVETDLLSSAYILNLEANNFPSEFGGITVEAANNLIPPVAAFITISLSIKPAEDASQLCSDISLKDPGTCYKVSTTLNAGATL